LLLVGALVAVACSSGQSSTKAPTPTRTFVFAPRVGSKFLHEMKNLEEFAIAGSNFRDSTEWRVLWEVTVVEQSDGKYLYRRRLVELGLNVNGSELLSGREVEPRRAEIVQVMSHDGHVLDVTGTEQLTETLASLARESQRAHVSEVFSPENLRAILRARAVDAFDEVVGRPSDVGTSWSSKENFGPLLGRNILVDSELGCGGRTCRKLKRTFVVDQEKLGDAVRKHVAKFMMDLGGEPAAVRVVDSNMKIEDTFVVEPDTCHFHDTSLVQQGHFVFEGPKKNRVDVVLTSKQSSRAEYPPPG
jgi:hypothetical protein